MQKSDAEWKESLTPEQYRLLRQHGTERRGSGELLHNKENGTYCCAGCGAELFASDTKYDSGSGWPSFWAPLAEDRIRQLPDDSLGFPRIEVRCAACDGHLGHLFDDGPRPTHMRFCINSGCLAFDAQ